MIPDSSFDSASSPYSGWRSRDHCDGSIDGQGGVHKGLTPVGLYSISAMWPPSTSTVTRKASL